MQNNSSNYLRLFIIIALFVSNFVLSIAQGQNRKYPETIVNGIVTDSVTGEVLPFVNIYLKGSDLGVTADANGHFQLATDKNFVALQVSSLGYATKDFYVKKGQVNSNMNLRMAPAGTVLEEVVVTKKVKKNIPKRTILLFNLWSVFAVKHPSIVRETMSTSIMISTKKWCLLSMIFLLNRKRIG